jgi:hypothetical protein
LKVDCLTIVSSQNKHCMCMQQKLIQILNEITKNTHNNQASCNYRRQHKRAHPHKHTQTLQSSNSAAM